MPKNRVKELLKNGLPAVGHWVGLPCPAVSEILARTGPDWLLIDDEHGPLGGECIENHLRAMEGTGTVPLIRVAGTDPVLIKKALDRGAMGVICPLVNTPEQARLAVQASMYPPEGIRGVAGTRASRYGADLPEYYRSWNHEVLVIVQIETREALSNVESIAAVPGVDVLFIGPYDLSANMGLFTEFDHPEFQEAVDRVISAARTAGIASGYLAGSADEVLRCVDRGIQFVAAGTDARLLGLTAERLYCAVEDGLRERGLLAGPPGSDPEGH